MKNIELLELNLKLSRVNFNDIKDGSFQYAISKIRDILKRECKIIEEAIETLKKMVKNGLPEDVEKDSEAEVQKIHDKYIKKIDEMLATKEKEIMTV